MMKFLALFGWPFGGPSSLVVAFKPTVANPLGNSTLLICFVLLALASYQALARNAWKKQTDPRRRGLAPRF